jgi:hypothetical protein
MTSMMRYLRTSSAPVRSSVAVLCYHIHGESVGSSSRAMMLSQFDHVVFLKLNTSRGRCCVLYDMSFVPTYPAPPGAALATYIQVLKDTRISNVRGVNRFIVQVVQVVDRIVVSRR